MYCSDNVILDREQIYANDRVLVAFSRDFKAFSRNIKKLIVTNWKARFRNDSTSFCKTKHVGCVLHLHAGRAWYSIDQPQTDIRSLIPLIRLRTHKIRRSVHHAVCSRTERNRFLDATANDWWRCFTTCWKIVETFLFPYSETRTRAFSVACSCQIPSNLCFFDVALGTSCSTDMLYVYAMCATYYGFQYLEMELIFIRTSQKQQIAR